MIFLPRTADLTKYFHLVSDISKLPGLIDGAFLINAITGSVSLIFAFGTLIAFSEVTLDNSIRLPLPVSSLNSNP